MTINRADRSARDHSTVPRQLPVSQLGVHVANPDTADAVTVYAEAGGVIMGVNQYANPVTVTLFRREATAAVAVGGLRFAQLIAFRALAVGAQVVVQTGRENAWNNFARACAADPHELVIGAYVAQEQPGTPDEPQLLIVDGEATAVADGELPSGGAWSTVLTVRNQLSAWDTPVLGHCDVALMQRLSVLEARLACPILNVTDAEQSITRLRDDMVALIAHSEVRWVGLAQTAIEHRVVGPLARSFDMTEIDVTR